MGSLIVINKSSFIAGSIAHGSFGGIGLAIYFSFYWFYSFLFYN
jgi:zinc transport system permease protein